MGLRIEKVQPEDEIKVTEFFNKYSIDEFEAFFPVEIAQYAKQTFVKKEYFYAAYHNDTLVGAILFTVQGGVGQLTAIQVDRTLEPINQLRIRKALLNKFVETCKEEGCHICFMWIPHQYVDLVKYYLQEGFERIFTARNFWYKNDYLLLVKELMGGGA